MPEYENAGGHICVTACHSASYIPETILWGFMTTGTRSLHRDTRQNNIELFMRTPFSLKSFATMDAKPQRVYFNTSNSLNASG
jgi:hypothetical protein